MAESLGFLTDLLDLWRKWGDVARDLVPIIRRTAEAIAKESKQGDETDTEQARRILEMAKVDKAELDQLLADDLASLE